jgi:hypothetical protein
VAFATGLPGGRRRAIRDVAIMGLVGAISWVLAIGYFSATGRHQVFWINTFRNAVAYAGNPLFNFYRYVREGRVLPPTLWFAIPIMVLIVLGLIRDRRGLFVRHWALFLAALLSLQIKIPLNGRGLLPHYYQYWLPLLAIGAGWAAGPKSPRLGSLPSWAMPIIGLLVVAFLFLEEGRYYSRSADEWSRVKYGESILKRRELGLAIRNVLASQGTLYQHGDSPDLYYQSGRLPPSSVLWLMHLNDDMPLAPLLLKRHLAALTAAPPDLMAVQEAEDLSQTSPSQKPGLIVSLFRSRAEGNKGRNAQTVLDVLLRYYRPVRSEEFQRFAKYRLYVRRGSQLDKRV